MNHTCSFYETETDYYQGSYTLGTWIKKVTTQYQYQADPFDGIGDGTTTETNVLPTQVTTIFPNGQQSQVQMSYDSNLTANAPYGSTGGTMNYTMSYGKNLEERDYDYGTPGPLLRRKDYTYLAFNNASYLAANMLDRVASETIYNGTGTQIAQTTYGYDEYAVQTTSMPQHTSPPYSVRGNRTSVKRWLNTTGGTLNTTTTYYDTGMPYQVTDPKLNVTTYTYSGTYDGAYVTQTTMPPTGSVQHIVSATYDFNTGKMATFTDQNGQPFSYSYDTLWRPTTANYPDTGQTTLSYPTLNEIVTTEKMSTSQNKVLTLIADGLGRTKQTQLNSDPDGTVYTDTTYDGDGRVHTVSNPYRSTGDPTYGITTYLYDPTSRGCLVAPPDATPPSGTTCPTTQPADTVFTVYSGNSTTVTDEQGKTRQSLSDGLGRLTSVIEKFWRTRLQYNIRLRRA